jgi:S1-C subfamily serine protease
MLCAFSIALTADGGQAVSAVAETSAQGVPSIDDSHHPKDLYPSTEGLSEEEWKLEHKAAEVLRKLAKNLIRDRTRGAKEVAVYQVAAPAVVYVQGTTTGTGTIIDAEGHVLTNWHVVGSDRYLLVYLKPQTADDLRAKPLAYRAMVERVDREKDLALLKILHPPNAVRPVPLGDPSVLKVGQDVHAIGHPMGEVWSYTTGVISQIRPDYEWRTPEGVLYRYTLIQTQTPLNPGNSGGPLLDDDGKLVGVNTLGFTQWQGLNFAVSIQTVREFLSGTKGRGTQPVPPQNEQNHEPRCQKVYDFEVVRIAECYSKQRAGAPDLWDVYRRSSQAWMYSALASQGAGRVDSIMKGGGSSPTIFHYHDFDCDGIVDLIGYQPAGSKTIASYQVPQENVSMVMLASELDRAFRGGPMAFPVVRICQ